MRILKKKFIYLKATSFNINLLIIYYYYLQKKFNFFFYKFNKIFFKKQKIITLLKSPHVHKKAREQFELKKFSFIIILKPMFLSKWNSLFYLITLNTPKIIDTKLLIKHYLVK